MQMTAPLDATFQRNLRALNEIDPALARRLEEYIPDESVELLETFDGIRSFWSSRFSRSGWFASTGMPTIREQVVIDQFRLDGANPLLPGSGQGYGLSLMLGNIAEHQTAYVWEPEVLHLALLLRLYDLSDPMTRRRLVLLTRPDLCDALVDFFAQHPFLTPPSKMLAWPWLLQDKTQELSRQVEAALRRISGPLAEKLREARDGTARLEVSPIVPGALVRVLVVSLSQETCAHQFAADMTWAFLKLGQTCNEFLLDRPEHGSALALASAVTECKPQLVISVGMDLSDWPIRLPETLPCASVLSLPGLKLTGKTLQSTQLGKNEILLATAGDDPNTVADKIPKDNFIEMDLAVNPDTFKPLKSDELDRTNRCDILLVADIADLDCRKYGVTQQSHQTLWRHLVSQVTRTPLRFSANDAESLLRRAGRETQIELDDQELFDEFANLLRRRLLPSAGALSIARTLVSAGYVVGIYGSGWENHNDLAARIVSASKDLPELNRLLNSADRVLYLNYETNWRPIVLSALCAGKPVIVQTLAGDSAIERAPIREAMVQLSSERTLVEQIEDIRRRRQQLEKSAMRAREYLIEHHSFEKIAQTILNRFGQSD
jgi:hypothetical protein